MDMALDPPRVSANVQLILLRSIEFLNAVCQVPKKKPASFKKIFRWFISHHRPDSVWKKDAKVPHKRKLPSTFSIDKALA